MAGLGTTAHRRAERGVQEPGLYRRGAESNNLRRQYLSEVRLRRYVLNTILFVCLLYLVATMLMSDMGVLRYAGLVDKQASLEGELAEIREQNTRLKLSLDTYRSDSYYLEKHAREDFGMVAPGEVVFIYKKQ